MAGWIWVRQSEQRSRKFSCFFLNRQRRTFKEAGPRRERESPKDRRKRQQPWGSDGWNSTRVITANTKNPGLHNIVNCIVIVQRLPTRQRECPPCLTCGPATDAALFEDLAIWKHRRPDAGEPDLGVPCSSTRHWTTGVDTCSRQRGHIGEDQINTSSKSSPA